MDIRGLCKVVCIVIAVSFFFAANILAAGVIDKVLVVVNDEVITQREFDRAFFPIKQSYEANFKGEELEKRLEMVREALMDQLINTKLAISLARKDEVEIDEAELQSRVDAIKSYYGSDDVFLQALGEKGTNLTEFTKEIREQMMAQQIVETEVASKIVITPAEISDLYEKNKERLVSPRRVKARGIMVRKGEGIAEEEAKSKMDKIKAEIKKKKDFSELAKEYSEGPYAEKGGDMGYIVQGQLLGEMDEAIFNTEKGKSTDIVETKVGYHVFMIDDIQEPRNMQLEEVSDFLHEQLFKKKFEEDLLNWLKEKRKNAYIAYK